MFDPGGTGRDSGRSVNGRRVFVAGLGAALLWPGRARAQSGSAPVSETAWIPITEAVPLGGTRALRLEATVTRPAAPGRHPLLVFNHGSTGAGRAPATATVRYPETAAFFVERRFAVVIPMRRGRGASEGDYRETYECDARTLARGVERGLADVEQAIAWALAQPWADPSRFLLGGMSRGGFLSILYPSERQTTARGVVNLAGGWTVERCDERISFHASTLARAGRTRLPMLWLYSENDRNYGPAAVRSYHRAFTQGGGQAELRIFPPIGNDGHILLPRHPEVWGQAVDDYLRRIGLG